MPILTFGINHKTAPVAVRERVAFDSVRAGNALQELMQLPAINEAVLLSTCNRTEIYTIADNDAEIRQWLHKQYRDADFSDYCYDYQDVDSVRHLLRVASGLDSMIIGEPQIFGQIKRAYQLACDVGAVGKCLQHLFPAIFAASKAVRQQTEIGKSAVSVAYAATQLARRIFTDLANHQVLLIGAGNTIELLATHLYGQGVRNLYIANRTIAKASELADQFHGTAMRIGDIPLVLPHVDILVTATSSQLPIIGKGMIESTLKLKKRRPIFMVDLAVPRDIESQVGELEDVYLYNIDDLQTVITQNLKNRERAAQQAEAMIEMQALNYMRQLRVLDAGDIIRSYRNQLESLRDQVLLKATERLQNGDDPQTVMQFMSHSLINKIMHQPTLAIRQAACNEQIDLLILAKDLFNL